MKIRPKWENRAIRKNTVIAFSNNYQYSILITRKLKRDIYKLYRGKVRDMRYKLFSIGVFYCLKNYLKYFNLIVIDYEYIGKENLIKSFLISFIKKRYPKFNPTILTFDRISKNQMLMLLQLMFIVFLFGISINLFRIGDSV